MSSPAPESSKAQDIDLNVVPETKESYMHMELPKKKDVVFRPRVDIDNYINQGILPVKLGENRTGEHSDMPRKRGKQDLPWEFKLREHGKDVYDISFNEESNVN